MPFAPTAGKQRIMTDQHPTAVAANRKGMAALQEGNAAAAVAAFQEAAAVDPQSGALRRNLASAHRVAGDDDAELAALDAALAIDQLDLVAWMRKAELHQRRGENGAAMAAWHGALSLAEPLKPWSGPLATALDAGAAFQAQAVAAIAAAVDRQVLARRGDLDGTETRRFDAFVDIALGRRRRFANECAGLCYPFLPADEFFDDRHFPWFAELASATDAIRAELRGLLDDPGEHLRPYVRLDQGSPGNPWSGLDQSLDWGACFLYEYGEPNQAVIDRCPATAAAMRKVPGAELIGRAPNIFFSILKPKTRIPPHTGVTNTRAIIHLPLIVPDGCGFRVGGETRSWIDGRPFAFDDTIEHEAWNDSDALRAVLIFDVWNPHLSQREQQLVAAYYQAADSSGYSPLRGD